MKVLETLSTTRKIKQHSVLPEGLSNALYYLKDKATLSNTWRIRQDSVLPEWLRITLLPEVGPELPDDEDELR